ncbi:hypothetical protein LNKW23_01060 [Paralimibaculum aggregatum]|uniref:Cupin type-2 domain-containing protein n=1 Tax=Paralimibaculum aggregatum TaxID=3036245 RepID=A0ABQ6LJQ0_9RHOB|nr:cupin domain-containing protein [Limibaculum sp. NKW23]GMG80894.1 hypothetical protein LNKW23_01060 [Limibaculum sp. NKW23]
MSAPATQRHVWPAAELETRGFRFGHPLDAEAEAEIVSLARLTGLARTGVNLVRVAPGRRAFPTHRHHREEEWVYVLSGTAEIRIGAALHRLGPGGFAAFPAGGEAHSVRNPGDAEPLLCLMGGETTETEAVDFPDQGKRVIRSAGGARIMPLEDAPFDFFSRTPLPAGAAGEAGE